MRSLRVFITASTGLIGSDLIFSAPDHFILGAGYNVNTFIPRSSKVQYLHCDITREEDVFRVIHGFHPDIIIHTAAKASPDYCEQHQTESREVNVVGTEHVIRACKEIGASMICFSSNAVFNGEKAPYNESSELDLNGEYGKHKAENELFLSTSGVPYTLIRSMSLYGWHNPYERRNFLGILLEKCMTGSEMRITNDVVCNFLYVRDLTSFVWDCVRSKKQSVGGEIFHIAGVEGMTHWDFTQKAIREFGLNDTKLSPISMSQMDVLQRGKDTRFDCSKAMALGFHPLSASDGMRQMRKVLQPQWRFL